jgi:threonine dehydratase
MTLPHLTEADALCPESISILISSAYDRIQPHLLHSRLVHDVDSGLYLKCEHEQHTGSFKWRGALSKLSSLRKGEQIVTASTGNHGLAVSKAATIFGLKAKIFIPASASKRKIEKLRQSGADIIEVNGDSLHAELSGKKFAEENNFTWVSPYNDALVIAGQGTIGLELDQDLNDIDRVYVTVGGGGLISGIASWMRHHHPHVEIIGCQPLNSPEMYLSMLAGEVVNAPEALDTLSDGSAGPLEEASITFSICKNLVDRFVIVDEEAIRNAIKYLYEKHGMIVEGAAGVAMAAASTDIYNMFRNENSGSGAGKSVVILCGGNIDPIVHQRICS